MLNILDALCLSRGIDYFMFTVQITQVHLTMFTRYLGFIKKCHYTIHTKKV